MVVLPTKRAAAAATRICRHPVPPVLFVKQIKVSYFTIIRKRASIFYVLVPLDIICC